MCTRNFRHYDCSLKWFGFQQKMSKTTRKWERGGEFILEMTLFPNLFL